jgi:hypothetical protein
MVKTLGSEKIRQWQQQLGIFCRGVEWLLVLVVGAEIRVVEDSEWVQESGSSSSSRGVHGCWCCYCLIGCWCARTQQLSS